MFSRLKRFSPRSGDIPADRLRRLLNLWPPFLFTGIHITTISDDFRDAEVELRQRWYNRNYFGTHFGGSLFAMTDAMYAIQLIHMLGPGYQIWDQNASIEFVKPGRGVVTARFHITDEALTTIREHTAGGQKYLPRFSVDVTNADGEIVARVMKTIYVRRKAP